MSESGGLFADLREIVLRFFFVVFCSECFTYFLLQPFQQSEKRRFCLLNASRFMDFFYAGGDLLLGGDSGLMCYVLKGKMKRIVAQLSSVRLAAKLIT